MTISNMPCAEDGRRMLFEEALSYFAVPLEKAETAVQTCRICGAQMTGLKDKGQGYQCQAQESIASKRLGIEIGDEVVGYDPSLPENRGMTAFSDGSIVVAGPHVSWVVTKVHPVKDLPKRMRFSVLEAGAGQAAKIMRELVENPPPTPFVVVEFSKAAGYPVRVTTSDRLIHVNGQSAYSFDRIRVLELIEAFKGYDKDLLGDAVIIKDHLMSSDNRITDDLRRRHENLKEKYPEIARMLPKLPSAGEPEFIIARRILQQMLAEHKARKAAA